MAEVISIGSKETNRLQDGRLIWAYCRANGLFLPVNCDENGNLGVSAAAGGATSAKQDEQSVLIGPVNEGPPASDTAPSGLNGRLQRIAQNSTATLGIPTGAAIITDVDGTIQRYLRGLVTMAATGTLVKQGGGALTDRSGTVTSGGTSQQVAAANASRKFFCYQNTSDETQFLNFGAAASAANSFEIGPKGYWESGPNFCPTGTVNMLGATTAKSYTAKEG